jgi:hypothetical protein
MEVYEHKQNAGGFATRLGALLPSFEIAVSVDGVIRRLRSGSPIAESLLANGIIYCPPADVIEEAAVNSGVPLRVVKVMDFIHPGHHWDHYRRFFTDELILSLMFPEEFRKRISGKVYIWNKWEARRRRNPNLIREPYLVDWKEVMGFIDWHGDNYGDLFDGDVVFLFEERDMISVFHHEGGFCHLYPGQSPYSEPGSLDKWLAIER